MARTPVCTAAAIVAAALLAGCGARGNPQPPVYPNPTAITTLTVAQRGSFAVLRFPPPPLVETVGDEEVELEAVEVLVYAERYPVLTADMLIAAIERRGEVMRIDAAAEQAAARARAARQAIVEQATAEGREPPPPDPDAPPTAVRRRTNDEDLIHRVPPAILERWRAGGLAPDAVLAAAAGLVNAVDVLWRQLGSPNTVIDPAEPVLLPSPATTAQASAELVERTTYERPLPVNAFLGRAAVSRSVAVEQLEELMVEEMLQLAVPVGTPSTGELRTRYFFAVRSRSTRDTPGAVTAVVPLAPAAVPVAPAEVETEVTADGVEITWAPPAGDVALRRLAPDDLRYNVYRLGPDDIAGPDDIGGPDAIAGPTPLNPRPLTEPTYTDRTAQWGEPYLYEVRALLDGAATPLRESEGTRSAEIVPVDVYPPAPPSAVNPTRAGRRVELRWTPSSTIDIVGYRVYRHPFPAPDVPLRFDPTAPEDDPAATAPPASGPPPQIGGAPAETDEQEQPEEPAPEAINEMVAAGWELLTPRPVPFSRHPDDADPAVRYVYAVEAIDAAGNLSALAVATEPEDNQRTPAAEPENDGHDPAAPPRARQRDPNRPRAAQAPIHRGDHDR